MFDSMPTGAKRPHNQRMPSRIAALTRAVSVGPLRSSRAIARGIRAPGQTRRLHRTPVPPRISTPRLSVLSGQGPGTLRPSHRNSRNRPRPEPSRRLQREAYISATQPQTGTPARLSPSHVHPRRQGDCELSPTQGPATAERLIDSCRSGADFTALRRGRRFDSELLWMAYAADPGLGRPRVAFALSRRLGTAVMRNRIRRRLRALLREFASDMAPGRYLFGARAAAPAVTYRRARAELVELLSAAGALNSPPNPPK